MVNLAHTLRLELGHTGVQFGVVHLGFTRNDPDKKMLNGKGEPELLAPRPERFKLTQTEVARGHFQACWKQTKNQRFIGLWQVYMVHDQALTCSLR